MHTIDDTAHQSDAACRARQVHSKVKVLTRDDMKARQICRKDDILYPAGLLECPSRVFEYVSDSLNHTESVLAFPWLQVPPKGNMDVAREPEDFL